MPKVKTLRRRHAEYDDDAMLDARALYEGGKAWRERLDRWLPAYPAEDPEHHACRHQAALYENHFGPRVDSLGARLFVVPAEVEGLPEDDGYWSRLWADCDRHRTSWAAFWRDRTVDALVSPQGRAWAWVDRPKAIEGATNPRDQKAAGALDCYLREVAPEVVVNWRYGDQGGLDWVVLETSEVEQASPIEPAVAVHRWTVLDRVSVTTYEWRQTPGDAKDKPTDEDEAVPVEGGTYEHGLQRVPLVELTLARGLRLGQRARDPVVAHARARSELSWALSRSAVIMLAITERAEVAELRDEDGNVVPGTGGTARDAIGAGFGIYLTRDADGKDEAGFIEPSGSSLQHLADDLDRRLREQYRLLHDIASTADPKAMQAAKSGASKAMDQIATEIVLSALAEDVKSAMLDAIGVIAGLRNVPMDGVSITGLDGWQTEDHETWFGLSTQAVDLKAMSPTARTEIGKEERRRLLPDLPDDVATKIDDELESASLDGMPPDGAGIRRPRRQRPQDDADGDAEV